MAPMRRKSQGSIRSPHVKRNFQSQVTFEGWLFKLEGGALKQWKQRWCVLVDFCLFFYKGPHEEKVTSSILLPSYKINPCSADDKISKKFAFKAEHQNMKTYYFAAEDKESMKRWMNAMSLASIMQKFVNSENLDSTFCSSYNDDDSGFTSYRSRRHPSNRSSSVHNTSSVSEPLKQRSNSCGDRVGEIYLGSDDKYPNLYKSHPSHLCQMPDAPRRQPLYANAPPKPRRLTQTEGFPVYQSDGKEADLVLESMNPDNPMPLEADRNKSSSHFDTQPSESIPDIYKIKPPRPRSADFLERDSESITPPYTSEYDENSQPQRPKSSLECYNRVVDCEEYDFDDYREAVRVQADNLYANKNLLKNKNIQRQIENVTKSDPRLNAHYVSPNPCFSNDPVPSYFYDDQHSTNSSQRRLRNQSPKPSHNESMQRLLEWKQRMLQSPLSRRNHLHSTSSDTSSVNSARQTDYYWQTRKQNSYISNPGVSVPYQDQNTSSSSYCNVPDKANFLYQNEDNRITHHTRPEMIDKSHRNLIGDKTENFYQSNIMYCVDSENNEILFSYDTSPSHSSGPATFHTSHYPPQMHSFSTLSNVNNIGMEHPLGRSSRSRHYRTERNLTKQDGAAEKDTAYSSDDEDVIGDCDLKETSIPNEVTTGSEPVPEEQHLDERYYSASPDYVNIGVAYRDVDRESAQEMYSSDSVYQSSVGVNQAVLKPLEQVSKNNKSFQETNQSSELDINFSLHASSNSYLNVTGPISTNSPEKSAKASNYTTTKNMYNPVDDFVEEMDCDIKREDYYRASQIFYSSMRLQNKLGISSSKNPKVTSLPNTEEKYQNDRPEIKRLACIDKDIGLPMPISCSALPNIISEINFENRIGNNEEENGREKFTDAMDDVISQKKEDGTKSKFIINEREVFKGENLTYEEMRGQLLRKREAPPPNIVQDRIKKFEKVEMYQENKSDPPYKHSKLTDNDLSVNRSFSKKNRQKNSRSRSHKRILHSDSEAIAFDDSDASSDDLTMKSAPILLSPLSSVLADLRKTADSGHEKNPHLKKPKEYPIVEDIIDTDPKDANVNTIHNKNISIYDLHSNTSNDFLQTSEDSVYLPMYGIKAFSEFTEPEYVTMSGSKSSPNAVNNGKHKFNKYCEEHVYNEPFAPPPSFLHDVYGKQKTKQFHYQLESSSSDDSLTENIYEKPLQRYPLDHCRNAIKAAEETNFVLMNTQSCSNVTTFGQSENEGSKNIFSCANKSKPHHYERTHLSVSVPDLLQLQEIKDSDASDADDEASRDFDTAVSSYQSTNYNHFYNSNANQSIDGSKLDSESVSYITGEPCHDSYKLTADISREKSSSPQVKCISSYETVSNITSNGELLESKNLDSNKTDADEEKKIHIRKLRVYTKGKKPEAPKIIPVPFNLEETELNKTTERKTLRTYKMEDVYQATKSEEFSFSENVAYASRADLSPRNESISYSAGPSYAPDIISSIKEEDRVPNDSISSFSKLSASAPYYYSDLYSGHGMNFSSHLPLFKQNDVPYFEKTSPPKSCTSLLNNIRPKSPSMNKSDVGRKVNNINVDIRDKQVFTDKPVLNYLKEDKTKNNLKYSLDVFKVSESKYLDAEKNKYEAGSTLEKTRPSSTVSYFKHRASTPDLSLCQYQSDEPVYENIMFQSKRMSQSLEEIPNASDLLNNDPDDPFKMNIGPVYENIDFFNKSDTASHRYILQNPKLEPMKNKESVNNDIVPDSDTADKRYFPNATTNMPNSENSHEVMQLSNEREVNFLDQDVLRRVSQQHFYSKGLRSKLHISKVADIYITSSMQRTTKSSESILNRKDNINYEGNCSEEISSLKEGIKHKGNDSDSTSDVTSSCDEASVDSDNRHRLISARVNYENRHSSNTGPDVTSKEAIHLKKLVQQSQGLMYKGKRLSVSAGDLLGKTHEELVLLLIQLRRNQSKLLKAKEKLERKLKKEEGGVLSGNQSASQHYDELHNQILHLEKQYEVTQPLVTLVDNMVKLGSLYGSSNRRSFSLPILDVGHEEGSSSPSPNIVSQQTSILSNLLNEETDLQRRISEINNFEKGLQNETNSISSLHQDKEMLEHTLCGMRNKILDHQDRPAELQKLRKQQRMIEKELVRVKRLLSTSAKKIEDAASKNDQMEQEILHLRQILQQALKTGTTEMKASQHNRADLEAELTRLQSVLDELANHRHEINNTVEKLRSEASSCLSKGTEVRASPTGVAGSAPLPLRKKQHSMYLETDLDTMTTRDLALSCERDLDDIPVYANAEEITMPNDSETLQDASSTNDSNKPSSSQTDSKDPEMCSLQDINTADERMKRFYGILPKEKPSEIKTVRIVKRQSERRSRERDKKKVSYDEQSSAWVNEEPDLSSDDYLETDEGSNKKIHLPQANRPSSINLSTTSNICHSNTQSAHERLFGSTAIGKQGTAQIHATKKSKRRHYTVSGYQYVLDPQFSQYFTERPRSRDDVDMERCLRTANTPDIVRSTIKKTDVFDEKLIERELGLPQKIEIPERYVEIEPEQLSATEKLRRSLKAENICKMLSETTTSYEDVVEKRNNSPEALHKKLSEEKRKRAQLLSLNQALAREVVERSKAVAVFATLEHMMKKPLTPVEEDLSPMAPLPITQQRYNFLT